MKDRTVFILFALSAVVLAGGYYAWHEYQRPPAGTEGAKADQVITADSLLLAFTADEVAANSQFNEKVVEVSGKVRAISPEENGKVNLTLETRDALAGVVCEFPADKTPLLRVGDPARVKGICTGYLIDVVLVRCSVVE